MGLQDWSSRRSPLQLALERGIRPGADLAEELGNLDADSIRSKADAEAVCRVLEQLAPEGSTVGGASALHAVVGLFQEVEGTDCPAFPVIMEHGIATLVRIVDAALRNPGRRDPHDVLFALKILAMYGTPEGTDAVLRAARQPLQPESFMWSIILQAYGDGHPEAERVFRELSDPLPADDPLAVALLDTANSALREGMAGPHPFDSSTGVRRLERWLTAGDEETYSDAISAAAALPFLNDPGRDRLLALAFDHAYADVQMEAAWAAARLGRDSGIRWLARSCLDVNRAERAKAYLAELGREDAIPAESEDGDFRAMSDFAAWLAHPNELGRPPDALEIIDHRLLEWPPDRERTPLWLIRYRIKDATGLKDDDIGAGLVGSVTFCLFTLKLEQRPPEDGYAIHCYWEMEGRGLIAEVEVPEASTEYDSMLRHASRDGLTHERIILVAELSPALKYPQRLVALASAMRGGDPGWLVLDGPRSRWYASAEMPAETSAKNVLMVHVGRVLLGFEDEPDRRKFLAPAGPGRTPEQVIAAYERLLEQARSDATQLLDDDGVLEAAFAEYAAALAAQRSQSIAAGTCSAYESLLAAAEAAEPSLRGTLLKRSAPLGTHFDSYVDSLIELGRQAEIPALIETFRPHMDHNAGYGKLGRAAFRGGHDRLAEPFLRKLRHSFKNWCRDEAMDALAEIWLRQGRAEEAHSLLIDALHGVVEQSRTATGSDRALFEGWFQDRRTAYLRLFADRGDETLRQQGIPASTLAEAP